jgi:endonuclease/exonuclease/phosphatase family metal-dependent hydrolase
MAQLKIVSFNLWKNEGHLEQRIERIVAGLSALKADVIGLQECFYAHELGIDVALDIAQRCSMHLVRAPLRGKPRVHNGVAQLATRSDMAILTRTPATDVEVMMLPEDTRDGDRALLMATLPLRNKCIRLGCTHLTHLRDDAAVAVRRRQAAAIMQSIALNDRQPFILMGDLNARITAYELEPLYNSPLLGMESRVHAASMQPAIAPADGTIDHILMFGAAPDWQHLTREVKLQPLPTQPNAWASDHPAIYARLEFPE